MGRELPPVRLLGPDDKKDGNHPTSDMSPSLAAHSISTTQYARDKRVLMQLIDEIRGTGAALDVDLPTIVVAGNQSAGKSSVIEAISQVKLPRAAGTCTRVPMEVRLHENPSSKWMCRVKLRREVDEAGNSLGEKVVEMPFGPDIDKPEDVESVLRRAQLALLNPSVSSENFVNYVIPKEETSVPPLGSTKQLAFSKNIVIIDISGPGLTDLTLIDLPGIIQSTSRNEDDSSIGLVTNMVKENISKDVLILLVITAKDDIQNQSAVKLARDVDPEGKRTIGVITKIDTLQGVEKKHWQPVVSNRKEPLLHGYFALRLPNADELEEKISFEEARTRENDFFAVTAPWKDEGAAIKARFGTSNLTRYLSDQLMAFIKHKLPGLIEKINTSHTAIQQDLDNLPPPPSANPAAEMLGLINNLGLAIKSYTDGIQGREKLCRDLKIEYQGFRARIKQTAPQFTPFTREELKAAGRNSLSAVIPAKSSLDVDLSGAFDDNYPNDAVFASETMLVPVKNLDDVREHIEKSITRELPRNVPFASKVGLIVASTGKWEAIALDAFELIKPIVSSLLDDLIKDIFGRFTESFLCETIRRQAHDILDELAVRTREKVTDYTNLESYPFTLNGHYFEASRDRMVTRLYDHRQKKKNGEVGKPDAQDVNVALAALAKIGLPGQTGEKLKKLLEPDEFANEIETMAEIGAYFRVAHKRMIDVVPQYIDHTFIRPLSKKVQDTLLDDLDITSEAGQKRCAAFLADNENTALQRADMKQKLQRLGEARNAIRKFQLGRI